MVALQTLVAAKRSPILGYNHNVRYRGIVFHIQTEDSGIVNPHVFTHLFHGGVIISTRKLVYDPGANDDAVKSLMQAQHKSGMKELRRGAFDDKIDLYLAGAPGLLPRETLAVDPEPTAVTAAPMPELDAAIELEPVAPPSLEMTPASIELALPFAGDHAVPQGMEDASELTPPAIELIDGVDELDLPSPAIELEALPGEESAPHELPTFEATVRTEVMPEDVFADETPPSPTVTHARPSPATTPPAVRVAFTSPSEVGRAPTERVPSLVATLAPEPDEPGDVGEREDVSAAMRAIQVSDEELEAAGLDEVAEIHSPAPPSAPAPPGATAERAGAYHMVQRPPIPRPTPVKSMPPLPPAPPTVPSAKQTMPGGSGMPGGTGRPTPVSSRVPTPSTPVAPRTPTPNQPMAQPPRAPTPVRPMPSMPARTPTPAARPSMPPPRTPTPPASAVPRPSNPPGSGPVRGRPASGGVVVSRPAVIVGGKGAPTVAPAKVRRARETEGFGGDLISERSLDEVILAYLSEDTSDE